MDAIGRLFDIVPTADAVEVFLRDATGVTFVCVGADTYTVQECQDAAGTGAANLPVIDHYYTNASAVGAANWVRVNQAPGPSIVLAGAAALIHVSTKSLTDGVRYLRCSSVGAGLVYAILHDFEMLRAPERLLAPAL